MRSWLVDGGWLLLLVVALTLAILGWWVAPLVLHPRAPLRGDGRTVASYGFDLSAANIPREHIVPAKMPKDRLKALEDPQPLSLEAADAYGKKYLVPTDLVIGVTVNGESRAYPTRVLNWHEIVNDTLGGVPIAVTYNALSDAAVVFDRRVAGQTLRFGVSGLLYNSTLLMFDRREGAAGESLWSQLLFRAVAGPAAAASRTLTVIPAAVEDWSTWRAAHPDTTVLQVDNSELKRYGTDPYGSYFSAGILKFPVSPLPPAGGPPAMTRMIVRTTADGRHEVRRRSVDRKQTDQPATAHAFWFAWHALWPEDAIVTD